MRLPTAGLILLALAACSDTDPKSRDFGSSTVTGITNITIDADANQVQASAYLQSGSSLQAFDEETLALNQNAIRLVDGDAFYLDWDGNNNRLFRREREFVYRTALDLPVSRNFNVRLDLESSSQRSSLIEVKLPDIASFTVQQVGQVLDENADINLSWALDLDGTLDGTLDRQSVQTIEAIAQPVSCVDAAGMPVNSDDISQLMARFDIETTNTSLTLPVASVTQSLVDQGLPIGQCEYVIYLQVMSIVQSDTSSQLGQDVRTILIASVLTQSEQQRVAIINATSMGATDNSFRTLPQ